jgi:23S rRNA (uracil-5-)-methyltransferase RumA
LGALKFKVGLSTFFQVNPYQTPNLYDEVRKWVPQGASVLDLYSGTGSIALWIASGATEVTGIEENRASVEAARTAAKLNKINNVKFVTGDTAQILPAMTQKGYSVAVVDPPRKGLDSNVIRTILDSSLQRLIYVSCNPQSLARDITLFKGRFSVVSVQGFDMFPHTEHVECVALMSRKKS